MQAFSIIAVRLMAAFFFVSYLVQMPMVLMSIRLEESSYGLIGVGLGMVVTLFIWFWSKPIGLFIAHGLPPMAEEQKFEPNQIVHAGTFLIGFWVFVQSMIALVQVVPDTVDYMLQLLENKIYYDPAGITFDRAWPSVAGMAVGVLVMGFSQRSSKFFTKQAEKSS